MAYSSDRLPSRFPVGTKFVIEGKRGGEGQVQVFSRYLEFPDGTFFRLPFGLPSAIRVRADAGRGARMPRGATERPHSANDRVADLARFIGGSMTLQTGQRRADSANGLVRHSENPSLRGLGLTGDRSIAFSHCVVSREYNVAAGLGVPIGDLFC